MVLFSGIQMLCEQSAQPLSGCSNVLSILKLQRGHEGGGLCYTMGNATLTVTSTEGCISIGVYFHIQANMSHLYVYIHHATCAAGIHATRSGSESLKLTSSFFLCR